MLGGLTIGAQLQTVSHQAKRFLPKSVQTPLGQQPATTALAPEGTLLMALKLMELCGLGEEMLLVN
jgi:hypothetical protein